MVTLQAGSFVTIIISIPFGIILARWLHPEGLGLYNLSITALSLIGILGYIVGVSDAGINKLAKSYAEREEKEVRDILSFVLKIGLIITSIVFATGMIIAPYISNILYHNTEITLFVRILLLTIPIGILTGICKTIFQGTRNIKTLVLLENLNAIITPLISVTAVLLGFGVLGVINGKVIGVVIGSFLAFALYRRLRLSNPRIFPSFREMLFNKIKVAKFKEFFQFSLIIGIDKTIDHFKLLLPIIFLGTLFPPQEVGYFALASSIIAVPRLFSAQVSRNLSAKIPEAYANGNIKEVRAVFLKVTKYSCLIMFTATVALLLVAPYLIKLFYGIEYIPSITVVYILGIPAIISGLSGLGPLYRTLNKVYVPICINVVTLPIASYVGWIAIREMGAIGAGIFVACLAVMSAIPRLLFAVKFLQGDKK